MPTDQDLATIKQLLDMAEANVRQAKNILFSRELSSKAVDLGSESIGDNIIEGVFDGEGMIGSDKRRYDVPANYASKSKLVAGDMLKLTILSDGSFLFKQICPIKRIKKIGILSELSDGKCMVAVDSMHYRVLPASISYFKAKSGDRLTILVPEDQPSEWAAVENLIETTN